MTVIEVRDAGDSVPCHGEVGEQSSAATRRVEQDQADFVLELSALVGEDGGGEPAQRFGCG